MQNMSSVNGYHFTFSFTIWIFLIYLPYLIALSRASIAILNSISENSYPCIFPDFDQKDFRLLPRSMILVFFINTLYHAEKKFSLFLVF